MIRHPCACASWCRIEALATFFQGRRARDQDPGLAGFEISPRAVETAFLAERLLGRCAAATGAGTAAFAGGFFGAGQTEVERLLTHPGPTQDLDDLVGQIGGQLHGAVILEEIDLANETAFDARLIGNGADDVLGRGHVFATHVDAIAGQATFRVIAAAFEDLSAIFTGLACLPGRTCFGLATRKLGDVGASRFGHLQGAVLLGKEGQGCGDLVDFGVVLGLHAGDHIKEEAQVLGFQHLGHLLAEGGDTLVGHGLAAGELEQFDGLTGGSLDLAQEMGFARRDEEDGIARTTRTAGAPDAVDVGLCVVGNVVVDHVADAGHVDAAGGHVGGDDDVEGFVLELLDDPLAKLLGHVAIEAGRGVTTGFKLLGEFDGGGLGAHEDDGGVEVVLDLEDAGQGVELVGACNLQEALMNGGDRGGGGLDLHLLGVAQVAMGNPADGVRHGGREEGRLALRGEMLEDPLHVIDEAHAQHLVGLVEHQGAQVVEVEALALDVVHDPARGADDHVGAPLQLAQLHDHALAAIDGKHMEARHLAGVALEGFGHLNGQFAGGSQNQYLGVALADVDTVEGGQGEGRCFAGAGLGFTQDVVACQEVRNAGRLDGGGGFVTDLGEGRENGGLEIELVETFDGSSHGNGARAG
jgi:hypothetical protein